MMSRACSVSANKRRSPLLSGSSTAVAKPDSGANVNITNRCPAAMASG